MLSGSKWRRAARLAGGALLWAALLALALSLPGDGSAEASAGAFRIAKFLVTSPAEVQVAFPEYSAVQKGDPLCAARGGVLETIGQVRSVSRKDGRPFAVVEFYDGRRPPACATFTAVPNPRTPAFVMEVLLPPERKAEILADLRAFTKSREERLYDTFWRPAELFIRDALRILQDDLPEVLEKRKPEIEAIIDRHKDPALKEDLLPVLKEEAWPIVRARSAPLIEVIGEELWEKLPVWGLGWRAVYEKVPFVEEGIVKKRWTKFVEEEAIPVLEGHTDEFLVLVRQMVAELMSNRKVTDSLKRCLSRLVEDPDFTKLLKSLFLDLVSSESRLLGAFKERFSSPEFIDNLNSLLEELGPNLTAAVERILSTDGRNINPDLAKILRTQILEKDACWILYAEEGGTPAGNPVFEGGLYGWREGLERLRASAR